MVTLSLTAALLMFLFVFWRAYARSYGTYHGEYLVMCPDQHRPARMRVDTLHVLVTTLEADPELRPKACSMWPKFKGCSQECTWQVDQASGSTGSPAAFHARIPPSSEITSV
jgi:hypothetical protein